ncbi:MAG: hypothetical protein JOZ69_01145 [Myxococcales bacterium]|nr:hypothetical protein [Myxococcales bacterium]
MARVTVDGEARFVTYLLVRDGFQPLCAGQCEVELPVGPQRFALGEPDGRIDIKLTMARPLVDVRDGARIRVRRDNGWNVRVAGIVLTAAGFITGVAIMVSAFGHTLGPCGFGPGTCSHLSVDGGRLAAGAVIVPLTVIPGSLMITLAPRSARVEIEPGTAAASWPRGIRVRTGTRDRATSLGPGADRDDPLLKQPQSL